MDVGRNNHPAARHFVAHQFGRDAFAAGYILHFFGDDTLAGIVHLRADPIGFAFCYPLFAHGNCSRLVGQANGLPVALAGRAACTNYWRGSLRLLLLFGLLDFLFGALIFAHSAILP